MDAAAMPCQALVRMLAKKPGWKETNFQVNCDSGQLWSEFLLAFSRWKTKSAPVSRQCLFFFVCLFVS